MDNSQYWPDGATKILELLQANFADQFRRYYQGEPTEIPESLMPAMIVRFISSEHTSRDAPTGFDVQTENILIKVVFNKKNDIGAPDGAILTETRLQRMMAGRDSVSGQYLDSSIMGVLRTNITMNGTVISAQNNISYQFDIQADDVITSEAWLTVSVRQLVPVTRS